MNAVLRVDAPAPSGASAGNVRTLEDDEIRRQAGRPAPGPAGRRRGKPLRPPLTVTQILAWADAHCARTGRWPRTRSGPVADRPGEKWLNIDRALRSGLRGLEGGSSLADLLARERGVRNVHDLPHLTEEQVVAWARAHRERTGFWPTEYDGAIPGSGGEVWANVDAALREGRRGFPGGGSLARLLARHLGVRNRATLPRLTVGQILAWADDYFRRAGRWPGPRSGPIPEAPGETWKTVDDSLRRGLRGLPGGDSLCRLLGQHGRGRANGAEGGSRNRAGRAPHSG